MELRAARHLHGLRGLGTSCACFHCKGMNTLKHATLLLIFTSLTSCSGSEGADDPASPRAEPASERPTAETRPAGRPTLVTIEGRVGDKVECSTVTTPDGEIWSFTMGEADFATGDYIRLTGEIADASYCQQGKGTLVVETIEEVRPPARDRDPARAGGLAVTSEYVRGRWVAKGPEADCTKPDFHVTRNSNGDSVIETSVNGIPATGYVDVGEPPALRWDEGIPALPIETRGLDGLAILPAKGARTVNLAGARIEGDGVVFVKCG